MSWPVDPFGVVSLAVGVAGEGLHWEIQQAHQARCTTGSSNQEASHRCRLVAAAKWRQQAACVIFHPRDRD